MATTVYAFSDNDVALRYREPYISAGLNSKYQGAVPVGVYEGFVPVPAVSNRTLYLQPGSSGYGVALATSSLDASYQVSVQIPGGQILDLNAYAGKTVDIGIEASYSFPSVTSAVIKAYDLSIETPPAYATMLCRVVVPSGATTIPSANISLTGRTFAWQTQSRDGISFLSVVKNGNFSFGVAGSAPDYWETVAGVGTLLVAATTPPSGYGNVIVGTAANTSAQTSTLRQYIGLPVTNNRGRLRVSLYYQQLSAPATSNPVVNVVFKRPDANNVQTTRTLALTTTGTATLTEDLAYVYTMSPRGAYLEYIEISFNSATYASSGAKFNISDVVVAIESDSGATDIGPELTGTHRTTRLQVIDPQDQSASGSETSVTYDSATGRTVFSTGITVSGSAVVSSTVTAGTSVLTPTVDTATAVALNIGTSTQTALTVGRVAAVTTVDGSNVNIGSNSASTTSVLVGSSAASNASVTVGSAPNGGTTSTAISANSINVGTSQYTTAINIGTASPATFRNIAVGADSAATTVAVTASTLTVGGVNTSNLSLGATTAGTATVTLGNASGAGTVTTSVQGHTLNIGTAANTTAVTIGDGATGTVRVNRYFDGNSGILSLGTDTTRTTSVEISRTGQTTTVQGNLVVTGTATFTSGVTASSVDSATVGGSVSVGGTNAGTISLGNAANTTVINIGSTVVGSAAIVLGNSAGTTTTSVLGKTVTLGDSSTTTVNIGASTAGAGTNTTRLRGDTIVIGDEANTDSVTLGDGASGTLRVNGYLDGNGGNLNIGTNTTQTTTSLLLGHTSALTTSLVGQYVTIGSSSTTVSVGAFCPTVTIGSSSTTTLTLGASTAGAGTNTTRLRGDTITIGDEANTDSVTIGDGTSGTVRVNGYLDGNGSALGIGTDTTQTATALTLGHTSSLTTSLVGTTVNLTGTTVTAGNAASNTTINIGTVAPAGFRTITVGVAAVNQTTNINGETVNLGDAVGVTTVNVAGNATTANFGYAATNVYIGNGKTSGLVLVGNGTGGNTTTTSIQGDTIFVGTNANTDQLVLGKATTGSTRVNGYLDGNSTGLSIGQNATATTAAIGIGHPVVGVSIDGSTTSIGMNASSGNVGIGRAGSATTIYGSVYVGGGYFDEDTAGGALSIGTVNAGTISLGRTAQEQRMKGVLVGEEDVHVSNGTGAVSLNTKITYPVYGCIGNSFSGSSQIITAGTNRFVAGSSWQSRNLTQAISPVGSEGFTNIPYGIYEYKLMGRLEVTGITGAPTQVIVGFEGTNLDFPGVFTGITYSTKPDGGGTFAAGDVIPLTFSGIIGIGTGAATGAMRVTLACNTGTVSVDLYYTFSIVRVAPAA